jgi:hypothetical protein
VLVRTEDFASRTHISDRFLTGLLEVYRVQDLIQTTHTRRNLLMSKVTEQISPSLNISDIADTVLDRQYQEILQDLVLEEFGT